MEKTKVAGIGCIVFSAIAVMGFSITILAINNDQLFSVTAWCAQYPNAVACFGVTEQCWASKEPLSDMTPCQYLYAVGALGLLFQVLTVFLPCMDSMGAVICMAFTGFLSFGWWIAAGIYFTVQFKDIPSNYPAGHYRDCILGVTWAAFGMTVVQMLSMGAAAVTARKSIKEEEIQYKTDLPTAQPTYDAPLQA